MLLHRLGLPLFYTNSQLLHGFLPHHSHGSNKIPDETLPVSVPAPPLCDTRKQPYLHLPLRQNQNRSRSQCHSVQSPTPVRLLFCTTLPSFPDFFPHHFHFCSRGQYYTVPAQGPALPLYGSIQTPVPSLLQHLYHDYSSHPVSFAPLHYPAWLPCGTALWLLPHPCQRRYRSHSTFPIHIELPASPVLPLFCTISQQAHYKTISHIAALPYTVLSHFPVSLLPHTI